MSGIDRRSVLLGLLVGVALAGATAWGAGMLRPTVEASAPEHEATPPGPSPAPATSRPGPPAPPALGPQPPDGRIASFAQQGEDLAILSVLEQLEIATPTYLDIGAFHPSVGSNTYLLYLSGGHGVLVEPNPAMIPRLRSMRPRDTVLEVGIGTGDATSAAYFVMRDRPQLNTFSRAQMERVVAEGGPQMLAQTLTRELVPIDDIIGKHFDPAPDVLSIDTEGLDLDILRTLDLSAHRPAVICAETLRYGTTDTVDEVSALLTAAGYVARGGTFVNTIFVDGRRLAAP